jgi:hypothetical protein
MLYKGYTIYLVFQLFQVRGIWIGTLTMRPHKKRPRMKRPLDEPPPGRHVPWTKHRLDKTSPGGGIPVTKFCHKIYGDVSSKGRFILGTLRFKNLGDGSLWGRIVRGRFVRVSLDPTLCTWCLLEDPLV